MPQFILIDHSIQDTTGHHYEYAVRVLEAAAKAGYSPILAANARFQSITPLPWSVFPLYPHGFWPRMAVPRATRVTMSLLAKALRAIQLMRTRLFFSSFGFLWLIRNAPVNYLRWHPFDSAANVKLMTLAGLAYLPLSLFFRFAVTLIPFRGFFSGILASFWQLARSTVAQVFDVLSPAGSLAQWRFARRKERSFGRATLRLLRMVKPGADDIVFVPTLAEPEMLGLLHCFGNDKAASLPSYHLLFRRNPYNGRESDFHKEDEALLPLRNAFLKFRSALSTERVFFYTDTTELSLQYERFKVFPFRTCPIPHTIPASEHHAPSYPIQITYLGDARAEKGYGLLPRVVQDLWSPEVENAQVSFLIQSNYNVEPGESEAVVARNQLKAHPPEKVRLITEACSSEAYREMLQSAGIMMLPYRADSYYARSSGVLIEALAAGIPVVAPATSWLARQIADPVYRYLASLAAGENVVVPKRHRWAHETPGSDHVMLRDTSELRFGGEANKAYTWVSIPKGSTAMLFGFELQGKPGEYVTCYIDQVGPDGSRVRFDREMLGAGYTERTAWTLIRVHAEATRVWIGLRDAFADALITIRRPTVVFLGTDSEGIEAPKSAVGVAYDMDSPSAATAALREVLAHFDHYKATARDFSETVYRFHNAGNLIQTLESAHGSAMETRRYATAV